MGIVSKHNNCECEKYKPDFKDTGLRFNGVNVFRCRKCCSFVDGTKWLGGLVFFSNRTRFVRFFECPCCGYRMTSHRRAKSRTIKSVQKQLSDPKILQPHVKLQLENKVKILQKMHLPPVY